jgi:hypothetical protein
MTTQAFRDAFMGLETSSVTRKIYAALMARSLSGEEPGAYLTGKLLEALKKQKKQPTPPPRPAPPIVFVPSPPVVAPSAKLLHKEHSHYHALMVRMAMEDPSNTQGLADIASKILELSDRLDSIYDAARAETNNPT